VAPRAGLEPATLRLTAGCSAIELPRNPGGLAFVRRPAARTEDINRRTEPDGGQISDVAANTEREAPRNPRRLRLAPRNRAPFDVTQGGLSVGEGRSRPRMRKHTNRPTHVTADDDRYERQRSPCGRRRQRKDRDIRASARFGRTQRRGPQCADCARWGAGARFLGASRRRRFRMRRWQGAAAQCTVGSGSPRSSSGGSSRRCGSSARCRSSASHARHRAARRARRVRMA
jgi:hypothetical protein